MRTTFLSQQRETLRNLRASSDLRRRAEMEVSSGVRTAKPSDSPSDAAGIVRTRADLAGIAQFRTNLETAQAELRAVDGALFQAVNALQRALTLGTQGANEIADERGRAAIAAEIEGVLRHTATIANTVYSGRYVFAGSADSTAPFDLDPASGAAVYRGDTRSRTILFPDGRPAQISLPGDAIFATPDEFVGEGRTAPPMSAPPPAPPAGIGLAFSGDLDAVLSVDLRGPFLAPAAPAGAAPGDSFSVAFTSSDGAIAETVGVGPLAGGENAAALAAALNASLAANPALAGKIEFFDQGGRLQLSVSDIAGTGFSFASASAGALTTGLEGGGVAGGYSAAEIAAALNAAVVERPELSAARVRFSARDGEVAVDGDLDFTLTALDFDRGTGFASGLAGAHRVGGANSADVFGVLARLAGSLRANDGDAIARAVVDLQRAVDHVGGAHAFYGGTLRQIDLTLTNLGELRVVNEERLSRHRDADILDSIATLQQATSAEQFAIQVAGRRLPTLLDVIA